MNFSLTLIPEWPAYGWGMRILEENGVIVHNLKYLKLFGNFCEIWLVNNSVLLWCIFKWENCCGDCWKCCEKIILVMWEIAKLVCALWSVKKICNGFGKFPRVHVVASTKKNCIWCIGCRVLPDDVCCCWSRTVVCSGYSMSVLHLYFWNSVTVFVRYYLRSSYLIYHFYLLFFLAYLLIN